MGKIIPYLNMSAKITIGNINFRHVISVKINESITELGNKAVVTVPRNFKKLNGRPILDFINVGDPVTIEIGYNGVLDTEFKGFVAKIGSEIPLVIECDDQLYPFKQNTITRVGKVESLKSLLQDICPDYEIDCPDMQGKFPMDQATTFQMLRKIQQDYALFIRVDGKKLTAGFSYDWHPGQKQWKYNHQKNVRKTNLTWKTQSDVKLRVKVFYIEGKKKKALYVGDPEHGSRTKAAPKIATSKAAAQQAGESLFKKAAFTGFTGNITGYGWPKTHAGDSISYTNGLSPEMSGVYLVDKVTIEYSSNGYSREVSISHKIDTA